MFVSVFLLTALMQEQSSCKELKVQAVSSRYGLRHSSDQTVFPLPIVHWRDWLAVYFQQMGNISATSIAFMFRLCYTDAATGEVRRAFVFDGA